MISSVARQLLSARGAILRGSSEAVWTTAAFAAVPCCGAVASTTAAASAAPAGLHEACKKGFSTEAASAATATATAAAGGEGSAGGRKVISSLVVERLPIILREDPQWEKEYREWQSSLVSKYKTLPPEFTEVDRRDGEDDEDAVEDSWKPAPRTTPADDSGDIKTTWRKLDRRLFLLVHNKQSKAWEFPSVEHQEGESIRAAAERNFAAAVGDEVKCYFVGNAPLAHYPLPSGDGTLFFNKVQIMQKEIDLAQSSDADDYAWVTSEEAVGYLSDKGLQELAKKMLSP